MRRRSNAKTSIAPRLAPALLIAIAALGCKGRDPEGSGPPPPPPPPLPRTVEAPPPADPAPPPTPPAAPLPPFAGGPAKLLGWWSFRDACSPASAPDRSGQGVGASGTGGVTCASLPHGTAASFDGRSGRFLIPDRPAFHLRWAVSIAAWVKPARTTGIQSILSRWYAPDAYMLGLENGRYQMMIAAGNGGAATMARATAPATPEAWAHVAGVFNGVTLVLYINGVPTDRVPAEGPIQDSDRPLVLGYHPAWNAYAGLIDEVRLYRGALTEAEVGAIVKQGPPVETMAPPRAPAPPLLVWDHRSGAPGASFGERTLVDPNRWATCVEREQTRRGGSITRTIEGEAPRAAIEALRRKLAAARVCDEPPPGAVDAGAPEGTLARSTLHLAMPDLSCTLVCGTSGDPPACARVGEAIHAFDRAACTGEPVVERRPAGP